MLAAAAVALMAGTATVTWNIARRQVMAPAAAVASVAFDDTLAADSTVAGDHAQLVSNVESPALQLAATYDVQINAMRALLAKRPALDSATARLLAENLRVIDDAIARVRVALDSMPSSALLSQQLVRAYDMKLNTLRQYAAIGTE
jgi:hypothetical protein